MDLVAIVSRGLGIALVLLVTAGCDSWPPHEREAREKFAENRSSLERLAEKIRATDISMVSLTYEDGRVFIEPEDESRKVYFEDDDTEWHELLTAVNMQSVKKRNGGSVYVDSGSDVFDGYRNRVGYLGFLHDPDGSIPQKPCLSEHARLACGRCAVELHDGWLLEYGWFPELLAPEARDAFRDDEISHEDYLDAESEALNECLNEGFSAIGYDVPEDSRPGSE